MTSEHPDVAETPKLRANKNPAKSMDTDADLAKRTKSTKVFLPGFVDWMESETPGPSESCK